jgi:hypothetical protein
MYGGQHFLTSGRDDRRDLGLGNGDFPEGGPIFTNSGATWASVTNSASDGQGWLSVASSADGNKLAASTMTGGFFASANAGTTWSSNAVASFSSLARSADGSRLGGISPLGLFYSINAGVTWTPVAGPAITNRIACSTNGVVLFGLSGTNIFSSCNSGASWATNTAPRTNWFAIAVSRDGLRAVAAAGNGGLYILNPPSLVLTGTRTNVSLLWNTNYAASGLGLAQNTNLSGGNWVSVPNTPIVTNSSYQVTLPATNHQIFFRLQTP